MDAPLPGVPLMTTIAWDGETLAADTRGTSGGLIDAGGVKAWRVGRLIVAGSGPYATIHRFREWVAAGMRNASPYECAESEGNGIVIAPNGRVLCFGRRGPWNVPSAPYSLGSGEHLALGAMAMGATAAQAVRVAAQFDTCTGGEITVLRCEPPRLSDPGA